MHSLNTSQREPGNNTLTFETSQNERNYLPAQVQLKGFSQKQHKSFLEQSIQDPVFEQFLIKASEMQ
jgi:hypothetical protein